MKKRFRRKKRGPVIAKKVTYDGITFASGLEKYMYIALRKAKIKAMSVNQTVKAILLTEEVKKSLVLNILLILLAKSLL